MSGQLLKRGENNVTKRVVLFVSLSFFVAFFFLMGLFVGTSGMSLVDAVKALFGNGEAANVRIVQMIRLPRMIAALVAGAGLALSGLILQSSLRNPMASPATLGISNAAVLGANVGLIVLSGGFLSTNNGNNWASSNPYAVSLIAFVFAMSCVLIVLGLSKIRHFAPNVVILSGIALGSLYSAITTIIQYFAVDTQIASAIYWTFGDVGRASFRDDWIMLAVTGVAIALFSFLAYPLNALSGGDSFAKSLGVKTGLLRFIALLTASAVSAVIISSLGIIGFLGIVAPHIARRFVGNDHRVLIPASCLMGAVLLEVSDILSRLVLNGTSLPVGAVTALFGAPFFLYIIFRRKEVKDDAMH